MKLGMQRIFKLQRQLQNCHGECLDHHIKPQLLCDMLIKWTAYTQWQGSPTFSCITALAAFIKFLQNIKWLCSHSNSGGKKTDTESELGYAKNDSVQLVYS